MNDKKQGWWVRMKLDYLHIILLGLVLLGIVVNEMNVYLHVQADNCIVLECETLNMVRNLTNKCLGMLGNNVSGLEMIGELKCPEKKTFWFREVSCG